MRTELEAVNYILSKVGAHPVTDINSTLPDVQTARAKLNEARQWIDKKGWWYNTEYSITLTPDSGTSKIAIGSNVIRVETLSNYHLTIRDGFLYDPFLNTDEFEAGGDVNMIVSLGYENLPDTAQDAVMFRAAKEHVLDELEDNQKAATIENDYLEALADMNKIEIQQKRHNALNTPTSLKMKGRVRPYNRHGRSYNPVYPGG